MCLLWELTRAARESADKDIVSERGYKLAGVSAGADSGALQNALTAAFLAAGVPLTTGTDSEGLGTQPGFGTHTELELFVRSGMKLGDAIRAATILPARVQQIC